MGSKDFTFEIKTKEGKVLVQEIATFGDEETPFPDDWENNGMALKALYEYREEFYNRFFDITFEERTTDLE